MKKILGVLFIVVVSYLPCLGQRTVDVSTTDANIPGQGLYYVVGGVPFVNVKFVRLVEGTPYFREEWMDGSLVANTGQVFKDLRLKLDLYDNQVHYQDAKGNELIATTPVKEVLLTAENGRKFRFVHSSTINIQGEPIKNGWYELMHEDSTASLFRYYKKDVTERKPYASSTTEQRILTNDKFLVFINNVLLEIKKPKDAPQVLANKKSELETFLKNQDDPKASTEARLMALVRYYNSLFRPKN
jgi:hypothetical protein